MEINEKECPKCQTVIRYQSKAALQLSIKRNSLCRSCSKAGQKRQPLSERTKKRISKSRKGKCLGDANPSRTSEMRQWQSDNNAMKNPLHKKTHLAAVNTPKKKKQASLAAKSFWDRLTGKARKQFIESRVEAYAKGLSEGKYKINSNRWKTGYYVSRVTGTKEWYDSSFEKARMKHYDRLGIKWTKKHGIKIPYVNANGLNTYYVPDFLLLDSMTLEEVKGWIQEDTKLKAKVAIEYCKQNGMTYNFLFGKDFKKIEELST